MENGKEVKRVINEKIIREKQDKVVAVGTKPEAYKCIPWKRRWKRNICTSTAYTASCNGCSGITATGLNSMQIQMQRLLLLILDVIPLGSKVYVEGYGYAVAADTGGAIKGYKIDVFFPSKSDAYRWGRKKVKIKILD